jgi:hypothetical protein
VVSTRNESANWLTFRDLSQFSILCKGYSGKDSVKIHCEYVVICYVLSRLARNLDNVSEIWWLGLWKELPRCDISMSTSFELLHWKLLRHCKNKQITGCERFNCFVIIVPIILFLWSSWQRDRSQSFSNQRFHKTSIPRSLPVWISVLVPFKTYYTWSVEVLDRLWNCLKEFVYCSSRGALTRLRSQIGLQWSKNPTERDSSVISGLCVWLERGTVSI